jgi:hypothetical protein
MATPGKSVLLDSSVVPGFRVASKESRFPRQNLDSLDATKLGYKRRCTGTIFLSSEISYRDRKNDTQAAKC